MSAPEPTSYIHGFSREEQRRLVEQAEILAPGVFAGMAPPPGGRVLEIGCGVGAELKLLAARFPQTHWIGIDRSPVHLHAARELLAPEIQQGQVEVWEADACDLPFPDHHFQQVCTIWMLEHAQDVPAVLREALRVLHPEGELRCVEVDNATFAFDPELPAIREWWDRFNTAQLQGGGDPFVGPRIQHVLRDLGADIQSASAFPNVDSVTDPHRRELLLDYLEDLLLSGSDQLARTLADAQKAREDLHEAFDLARSDSSIQFRYHAWRVVAGKP